ncbi:MAG TPA: S16 family serine protease [Labilithrix sp.]|nr:S16 family serine protease [Labilithrix sp.]
MLQDKKRAVVVEPRSAEARFALGEALHLDGDHEGAVAQLEKALELDAGHGNARRLLARAYLAQERFTLAEKLLRPAADEEDVEACDALADLYLRMNRQDDALLYLDVAARKDPERLDRRVRAAELALGLGLLDKAAEHGAAAAALARDDRRVRGIQQELATRRGDVAGAQPSPLERGEAFLVGRALASIGRAGPEVASVAAALRTGDVAAAKRALVTAPAAVKALPAYAWSRGEVALASADHDAAARAFTAAAVATDPELRARALRRLGEIAAFRGDAAAAREAYRSALEAKEEPEALDGLGDALAALGDAAAAEGAYQRAAKIDAGCVAAIKLGALRAARKHAAPAPSNVGRIGALGWGPRGGAVSPVEATCVPGKGDLFFTGNVGTIGREAAQVAVSCVKARAAQLGIAARVTSTDLHVHFTDMEVAKDGASAGLALALAAVSAYQELDLLPALAATGQITVNGAIKPVAGLHEKLVASCLAGIRTVLLPRRCILDLDDLPREVRRRVTIHGVDSLPEAIEIAFGIPASTRPEEP